MRMSYEHLWNQAIWVNLNVQCFYIVKSFSEFLLADLHPQTGGSTPPQQQKVTGQSVVGLLYVWFTAFTSRNGHLRNADPITVILEFTGSHESLLLEAGESQSPIHLHPQCYTLMFGWVWDSQGLITTFQSRPPRPPAPLALCFPYGCCGVSCSLQAHQLFWLWSRDHLFAIGPCPLATAVETIQRRQSEQIAEVTGSHMVTSQAHAW